MSATLAYGIKPIFYHLAEDQRWNVLSCLILHANIRNRCWPKVDTITAMATNGNRNIAIRAKKWLIEHKAIELVPHDKRVGEEVKLHQSRHVYQLTGTIEIADENSKAKTYPYLHFNNPPDGLLNTNSPADKSMADKSMADKSMPAIPHNKDQVKQTKTKKKTNTKQQQTDGGVGDKILNLCFSESVSKIFDGNSDLAYKLIKKHGEESVNAWCAYAAAQANVHSPVGLVRAKLKSGETPPVSTPKPAEAKPAPIQVPDTLFADDLSPRPARPAFPQVDKKAASWWHVALSQAEWTAPAAKSWLGSSRVIAVEADGTYVIHVKTLWMAEKFLTIMTRYLSDVLMKPTNIRFVDEFAMPPAPASAPPSIATGATM